MLRGIDDLRMTDLTVAAAYAEATAWQVHALARLGREEDAKRAGKEGMAVATNVLEKRPGHMQALRAQTLFGTPLATIFRGQMQLAEALAMSESELRGWKEFVRLDPGNAVSWGNMLVSYQNKNFILQQMGRPGEAAATLWTSLDVERQSPPSRRVRSILTFNAGLLALLEANRGNVKQAADALAAYGKLNESLARDAPPGFDEELRKLAPEYWRMAVAQATGEDRRALDLGSALEPKSEQMKPADEGTRRIKNFVLRGVHLAMAQAAYTLKDYADADREMMQVAELRRQQPWPEVMDKRDIAFEQAFSALVLTRLNRREDAQKVITPVLKFERELSPRNRDDPSQRYELAVALYVAAVAGLGDTPAQLTEASALMDKLPPEMRALRDVTLWRDRIAEERSRRGA